MSSEGAVDAPTRDEEQPEPTTFTLNVVSPSVGVSGPLIFPHISATTTIGQLKAKIRDALPTRPSDDHQRLIHRGRLLANEADTMNVIFGQDTLANPEAQTLHLVLRPSTHDAPPAQPNQAAQVQVPTPPALAQVPPPPQRLPPQLAHGSDMAQQLPGFQHIQQQAHMFHNNNLQAVMTARLQHLQQETERIQQRLAAVDQATQLNHPLHGQENHNRQQPVFSNQHLPTPHVGQGPAGVGLPSFQNLIAQHQRERAAEGLNGAGGHPALANHSGRASPNAQIPDRSLTYTREGVGPNGERWQVTVNETTVTTPLVQPSRQSTPNAHEPSQVDLLRTLRHADRAATDRTTTPVQSDPAPGAVDQGTATPPVQAPGINATASATSATPPVTVGALPSGPAGMNTATDPVVYLLSSPNGPRALLINNSESFYTPRQLLSRNQTSGHNSHNHEIGHSNRDRTRAARRAARRNDTHENAPEAPVPLHAGNPGAGALVAQLRPHIWLLVRLIGFIWFFTSGNNSWPRIFLICSLALVVFIANTGLLNGVAEQVWGPIRRHVDRLLPLAGPEAALVPAANAVIPQAQPVPVETQGNGPGTELDPNEVAARLIEQRRQANGWFMAQVRRAEHAMLLFLASLVPGVGERHIAAREAEAVAAGEARQRQIEAANAPDPQVQEQEQEAGGDIPGAGEGENGAVADVEARHPVENQEAPVQPLIDI
ncbi:ubiquitin family protein [Phlyctema vagabunda]|uniref:Ubiquitin family protein n=1 Tax=Phlyctema vagabunda TaxID=108571 RepID=A0ABR4PRG9_9HELO